MSSQKILDEHLREFKDLTVMSETDARAALSRGLARSKRETSSRRSRHGRTAIAAVTLAVLTVAVVLLFRNSYPDTERLAAVAPAVVGTTIADGLVVVGPALVDTTKRSTAAAQGRVDSVTVDTLMAIPDTGQGAEPERTPFQGVPVLELNKAEMLRFGFVPVPDGVEFYIKTERSVSYARYGKNSYERHRVTAIPSNWPAAPIPRRVLETRWEGAWVMIDDAEFMEGTNGGRFGVPRNDTAALRLAAERYIDSMEHRLRRLTNTLIPIRIRMGAGPTHSAAEDVIFWFMPKPDVLDRLPASLRTRVEAELAQIRSADASFDPGARTGERPALPLISTSGAIEFARLVVASGGLTALEFSVAQPRSVRIDIYGAHGERLTRVLEPTDLAPGVYRQAIAATDIPRGSAIISISTDRGERTGHRLTSVQ